MEVINYRPYINMNVTVANVIHKNYCAGKYMNFV